MNSLLAVFATLGAVVSAGIVGHGGGVLISGPSGVITPHGPIGPTGPAGVGVPYAAHGVEGPALGLGGLGLGGLGLGGLGHGGVGLAGHGIAVRGPPTVPAVIAGPSGKIVADGLYGVPHYGGHGW